MPWTETNPMDQKINLISDWNEGYLNKQDLSDKYKISRKAVDKWIGRYESEGIDGLKDRSRAPNCHPNQTSAEIVDELIRKKKEKRKWGPKKILTLLKEAKPDVKWPAVSTVEQWFKKEGLVKPRKIRKHIPPYEEPFLECKEPNDVWSVDYKGQFYTRNSRICYPLTISDNMSRYLFACEALKGPRYKESREVLKNVFREYGLPLAIRSDNGTPFAGTGVAGISRLSMWWIQLGIIPERIGKGKPQENGRHERMHRTLKEDIEENLGGDQREQQKYFDWFRTEYNEIRPHEALGMKAPAKIYERSRRPFLEEPKAIEYDFGFEVRKVKENGGMKFNGKYYHLSECLKNENVGIREIADGMWAIYYSFMHLGTLNLHKEKIEKV